MGWDDWRGWVMGWELARVQFSRTGIVGVVSSIGKMSYGAGKDYSFWWV